MQAATPVDANFLATQHIAVQGDLIGAHRLTDKAGEHVLVLSRKQATDSFKLNASYFTRGETGWKQEWDIRDGVDCPGLDADAGFFPAATTFTDLNHDGRMEVTVSYRTFCGGGVDPYVVKVILRDGATKLAIRGESLVRFPGQPPFGGEHKHDKALLSPAYAAYKQHLDRVWTTVSADNRK
ncbi:M949_RS01915 family surface polysaccharide biosynthesis protein [Duganella sp. CF517]|uniref:M949_RS01915 family surface polysaccharide biosynthesis protein n=1 Tax=Duganella sp. CF517 TaxID=1881038 RepID=UPI0015A6817F